MMKTKGNISDLVKFGFLKGGFELISIEFANGI